MINKLIVGWLDHGKAKLYWIEGERVTRKEDISPPSHGKREEHPHKAENVADKERMKAYRHYYADIVKVVGKGEDPLFLLGHVQALHEFHNYCEEEAEYLVSRLHETPADRLTEPEIIAYGRKQFK